MDLEFEPMNKEASSSEMELKFEVMTSAAHRHYTRMSRENMDTLFSLLTNWKYLPSARCIRYLEGYKVVIDGRVCNISYVSLPTAIKLRRRLMSILNVYEVKYNVRAMRSSFARILRHISEEKPNIEAYFQREDPTKVEPVTPVKVPWMEKPKYKKSRLEQLIDNEHKIAVGKEMKRLNRKKSRVGITALDRRPGYAMLELEEILGDAVGNREPTPA